MEKDNLSIWSVDDILCDAENLDLEKELYEREEVDLLLGKIHLKLIKAMRSIENIEGIDSVDFHKKMLEEISEMIS